MKRCYDKKNNRLVYFGESSNKDFWDKHWNKNTIEKLYPKKVSFFDYVINTSKKYLPKGSLILEGGCGTGQQVFKLQNAGYKVIGIDYAEKTVKTVKNAKPELNISLGDVRKLDFPDNYFDAYWSFGVIEHFYDGYFDIIEEMQRILKPNGLLFITFPHMSKFRKRKAKKNKYPLCEKKPDNFYQFALDEKKVISDLKKHNFNLVSKKHLDGLKGLKDETVFMKKTLQKIYDNRKLLSLIIAKIISITFGKFSSHSILLILRKT
ncbi:MAG: class I SAM-dependent methyltransferase [Bacteroidales bacterium]|nr:class I SAM-dependent methyltransferase [Bacteroidales bacterium]